MWWSWWSWWIWWWRRYEHDWQDGGTHPCFDEGNDRPDGNAGHGGGCEDSSCPVSVMMLTKILSKKFKPPVRWAQAGYVYTEPSYYTDFRLESQDFLGSLLLFFQIFYLAHGELWYLCHLKNDDEEKKQGGDELPTYLPVDAWVGQVWPDVLWFLGICEGFWKPPGRLPSMAYTSSEKFLRITISDYKRHQP